MKPDLKLLSIGGDDLNVSTNNIFIFKFKKNIYKKVFSLYIIYFQTANFIEIFDENNNEWIKPKSLNINRRNYSVAWIDDKVMLIGGTRSPDKDIEPLNTVRIFFIEIKKV